MITQTAFSETNASRRELSSKGVDPFQPCPPVGIKQGVPEFFGLHCYLLLRVARVYSNTHRHVIHPNLPTPLSWRNPGHRGIIGPMTVSITFLGAAEGVTGSRHLLEVNGTRILVDCGLFQGRRDESRERNAHFPIDPASIHNIILTHGHIDHSGALPVVCRDGFKGHIYCTTATADLSQILLRDSGHIQEMDAKYLRHRQEKDARKKGLPIPDQSFTPLYTVEDAEHCDGFFQGISYHETAEVAPGVTVYFTDQGHILGSAAAHVQVKRSDGSTLRIEFSGDRGRAHMPILRDPEDYPESDIVLTESTYGNRVHEPIGEMENTLAEIVLDMLRKGGRLVIPAFSVGRTQNILYHLHRLRMAKKIPHVEIYVDSPLSMKATQVYAEHPECFDDDTLALLTAKESPFSFPGLRYVQSVEESMTLNDHPGPCIILSASGMCESGRILHHLKHSVTSPRNTVLIVGYMAEHTLGRRIFERREKVKIYGRTYPLRCDVKTLNGLSAHGDRNDIIASVEPLKDVARRIVLVHGERTQSEPLQASLKERGHKDVVIAKLGSTMEL